VTGAKVDEVLFGMAGGVAAICALSVLVLEVGGHAGWPPAALDREGLVVVTKVRLGELFIAEAQKERLVERLSRIAEAVRREETT
jgi:hypothetical protein